MTKLVQGRRNYPTRDNERGKAISITSVTLDRSFVRRTEKSDATHPSRSTPFTTYSSFSAGSCLCTTRIYAYQRKIHNARQIDQRMINVDKCAKYRSTFSKVVLFKWKRLFFPRERRYRTKVIENVDRWLHFLSCPKDVGLRRNFVYLLF